MICAARPASMPTRNDQRWSPQGQGNDVSRLLPPESRVGVRGRSGGPTESTHSRADGVIFVLDAADPERALAGIPHAGLWQKLYRAAKRESPLPLLATRLPNARQTLAAVAFAKTVAADSSAWKPPGSWSRKC